MAFRILYHRGVFGFFYQGLFGCSSHKFVGVLKVRLPQNNLKLQSFKASDTACIDLKLRLGKLAYSQSTIVNSWSVVP